MEAEREPTGVTRGQNAVQVSPMDWQAAEGPLAGYLDRIDPTVPDTQILVITPDAENAVAAAHALVGMAGNRSITVVAATASARAARLLKNAPAQVVTGSPSDLVLLLQGSALKPAAVRGIVFAWLDPILETPDAAPLETILGEVPKEAARLVLATTLSPEYEALIERYARRARRAAETEPDTTMAPINVEYVSVTPATRGHSLRRLLDALDLPRAVLYARSMTTRTEASAIARALGYSSDDVRVVGEPTASTNDALVVAELPTSPEEMRAIVGEGARKVYVLAQPSQLGGLRALTGGGSATPVALIEAAERARGKDAALRASLREVLQTGDVRREVLALEPLLTEFDGIEIAAAALRLLEQQRPVRPMAAGAQAGPMQKLFVNLGEKDGVRTQEVVTMITSNAGIPGSQVGRVEVRDNHSIVEVAASVAELVVEKVSGSSVRGRIVQARVDQPREVREPRGDRPAKSFDRAERGERPARPPRSFDRGDRPARPSDRGERPARPFDRPDRPSRTQGDRPARPFDRGDRPARPFDKGDRPARSFDRGDRPSRPGGPPRGGAGPRKFDSGNARPTRPRSRDE